MSYLLGIDSGTSVVKSVVFDLDGKEVAIARRDMPVTNDGIHSECDMRAAWALTAETIREVLTQVDADQIDAIGLCGTACGFWAIDADGQPVRPAILWNDGRAVKTLETWQADGFHARSFAIGGNALFPGYPLVLLHWLHEHEPDTLARTRWLFFHKDWLRWNLTGDIHTDEADAAYFPGDIHTRAYSLPLLDEAGLSHLADCLPPIAPSHAITGTVTAEASRQTGLRAGTPVVAGAVDVVASLVGGGACRPGQACSVLGTSLLNTLILEAPSLVPTETGVQAWMPDGGWARSLINTSGTLSIDWMVSTLAGEERRIAAETGQNVYSLIEATVSASPLGARGLVFLPYLNTTGINSPFVDPNARGQFFGLSLEHTRADLIRAVYEGVALAMTDCYRAMEQPVEEIILVGGGARSAFWAQMFADATGARITIPSGSEYGARGAALLAGVGAGRFASVEQAVGRMVRPSATYEPNAAHHEAYQVLYGLYSELSRSARPNWARWRPVYEYFKGVSV
ncbi:MAG: carbohydrate kinase [Pleurocapsa minor GSE-CHR-MK-17-07R]|jgi:sugar (pentulose or hexulose) kinase|nr:carbohydrate kinase [Pleurocapsa minor GSE-CHR-MK 17-07R]